MLMEWGNVAAMLEDACEGSRPLSCCVAKGPLALVLWQDSDVIVVLQLMRGFCADLALLHSARCALVQILATHVKQREDAEKMLADTMASAEELLRNSTQVRCGKGAENATGLREGCRGGRG